MEIKEDKIHKLREKINKFEEKRKNEYSDFKNFLKIYLNTPEKNEREKLAEEFRARHMELHNFLKNNPELISAESEMVKMINGNFSEKSGKNQKKSTNFFEILEEECDDL